MEKIGLCTRRVPDKWLGHFDMLRDDQRNTFYGQALHKLKREQEILEIHFENDDFWCEIGCGSGLLACLVAKILNRHVIAFECVPELAAVARETVALNSLGHLVLVCVFCLFSFVNFILN